MSETAATEIKPRRRKHYNGRGSQVMVYLGKQLRFFVNQSDWKVLPMAAVIAALVAMVIRKRFFINMEGSLIGGFALTCVAIWNGCFNSIQAVCRERAIIKREHRAGLHITAYVAAHMIYQLMLCMVQTAVSMYVMKEVGVQFPKDGFITQSMMLDIGISMLLISYAADMMSLFLSSMARTTTGAMTLMPFVLIFQLVFSGGIIPLPSWSQKLSDYTISNYGIRAIASQSGYNELPMVTAWNTLVSMKNNEIGGTVTLGKIMDYMDHPVVEKYRDQEVIRSHTVGEAAKIISDADQYLHLRDRKVADAFTIDDAVRKVLDEQEFRTLRETEVASGEKGGMSATVGAFLRGLSTSRGFQETGKIHLQQSVTLGDVLDTLRYQEQDEGAAAMRLNEPVTVGKIVDVIRNNEYLQQHRDRSFTLKTTVGDLLELFGEENVKKLIQEKTAAASYKVEYEKTYENILRNWLMLVVFVLFFALLSTIVLELIDKDKR